MASREHWADDGKVHVKVSTINTDLAAYVEWGAEAWRWRKHQIPRVWWQPWTWNGYEWRQEGAPPTFTDVSFFRANGSRITNPNPPPVAVRNQPGYFKYSVSYLFGGLSVGVADSASGSDVSASPGSPPDTNLTGDDARAVQRVKVTYMWEGEAKNLSQP